MRRDRKETITFIIILLILSMGIGYAFLTTTLSIEGTSDIDSATWDVHWDNLEVDSSSITGSQVTSPATISADGKTVSFHIKLNEPGDYYAFLVDAVNSGTLNAYVDNISFKVNGIENNMPSYIIPFIFCTNNSQFAGELHVGRLLFADSSDTYYVGLEYNRNVSVDELPDSNQSLDIDFNITFSQYVPTKNYNNKYVYTYDKNSFIIGSSIPNYNYVFDDYKYALANYANFQFVRHNIENNIITSSDVGFMLNNNIYYLKGGDGGSSYNSNKLVLQNIFINNECDEHSIDYNCNEGDCPTVIGFECSFRDLYGYKKLVVYDNGSVEAYYNTFYCHIGKDGSSNCDLPPNV